MAKSPTNAQEERCEAQDIDRPIANSQSLERRQTRLKLDNGTKGKE